MTAHGHVTAAPHRREGYTLRAARQPRSSERDLGADSSRTQLDGSTVARCPADRCAGRLGPSGCWSREWCLVGMGALGHGTGAERYFRCTIPPRYFPTRHAARQPDRRARCFTRCMVYGAGRRAACPVRSFHATLRSFPIGFLDNSARLNQISANQISANEQKRVKPGIGVTHRPRMVDRKRSERRSIGSARHLAAHGASRDVRTPPAQTSDPRAHMMFRDVQCYVGRQPTNPPPKRATLPKER